MKRPLAGTVLVYAAGIWAASFVAANVMLLGGLAIGLLGAFIAVHLHGSRDGTGPAWEKRARVILWVLVFVTGLLVSRAAVDRADPLALDRLLGGQDRRAKIRGVIISDAARQTSFRVAIRSVYQAGRWQPAAGRVFVFVRGREDRADDRARLRYGDLVESTMFLRPPRPARNPGEFDFRAWLARHRIYLVGSLGEGDECRILERHQANPVRDLSLRLRERFSIALRAGLETDPDRAGVMAGMVIGERAEIPPDTYAAFQQTGAFHVFAISGLHVGLVTFLVMLGLRLVCIPRRWCGLVAIPLLILYVFATGARPGAVRALVMATVFLLGRVLVRPTDLPNTVAAAALLILAVDPSQLFDGGFILSFTVVTGLVLLTPPLADWLNQWTHPDPLKPWPLVPAWQKQPAYLGSLRYLNNLVAGSVAAWLGLIPLMAIYFNLLTPVSVLANLVAVPLLGAVIALGMSSILVYPFAVELAEIFNNANYLVLGGLETAVNALGRIPGGHLFVQAPPAWWAGLYYGGLVLVLAPIIDRRWRRRLVLVGVPLLVLTWILAVDRGRATVITVLDLYRGQAALVDVPGEREDILVDTGDLRGARRVVVPFLRSQGVDRLDTIIISRATKAQVSGFGVLSRLVPFRRVVENGLPVRSIYHDRWREQLAAGSHGTVPLRAGAAWQTSGGLTVRVLHPPADWNRRRSADNALVFALEQSPHRVLFLPSAGETVERALLAQPADRLRAEVIVCGGHDHESAWTAAFLEAVNPQVIILAEPASGPVSGARDPAGPALLDRLRARSIRVFRTAESGAIRICLTDRGYSVEPWL